MADAKIIAPEPNLTYSLSGATKPIAVSPLGCTSYEAVPLIAT